jgi:hypothetical protein
MMAGIIIDDAPAFAFPNVIPCATDRTRARRAIDRLKHFDPRSD